jgi:hypothetical protein
MKLAMPPHEAGGTLGSVAATSGIITRSTSRLLMAALDLRYNCRCGLTKKKME